MFSVKKTFFSLALISATSLPVWAAESVEVKVTGTIKPVACTPTLAGGGVMDYGVIKASDLKTDDYTVLPVKSSSFSIACDAPALVAVKAINNRPGTVAGATEGVGSSATLGSVSSSLSLFGTNNFSVVGLGNAQNNAKIGGYAIRIEPTSVTADGTSVQELFSWDNGASWGQITYGGLYNASNKVLIAWSKKGSGLPVAFKTLSATLEVQPYINKASALDLKQPITLNGSTTLELVYL